MSEVKKETAEKKTVKAKKENAKKVSEKKKEEKVTKTKEPKVKENLKEEKNKKEVLLSSDHQKKLKGISKAIYIIAKIAKVCAMIVIPFIVIVMIAFPIIFSKIEVNGNIISYKDVRLVAKENHLSVKLPNGDYVSNDEIEGIDTVLNFLEDNSKGKIIAYFEIALLFVGSVIVVSIYLLSAIEKLFTNIYNQETPFTKENSLYVRNIACLMLLNIIVSFVFELILEILIPNSLSLTGETYGIIEILAVCSGYYIFTYAYKLQEKANTTIYDLKS